MDRRQVAAVLAALALAAGSALAAEENRAPARIAEVQLRLPPGEDLGSLLPLVDLAPGDALSTRALRRTVQHLWQTGRFRNVVIHAVPGAPPAGEGGEWVVLVIEAQPVRIVASLEVRLEGEPVLDAARVRSIARLTAGDPYDDSDLAAAAGRVRGALARRGYRAARVEARVVRGDAVELLVSPGDPVRIRAVALAGDPGFEGAAAPLRASVGAVLDEDRLEADVRAVRLALHGAGFRRARVGTPVLRVEGNAADVEVPVEAGPRLVFTFRGNAALPAKGLERQLGLEDGLPVDAPALQGAAERLRLFYRARGFAAARVRVEEARRGREAQVVFRIEEGRRYRIGSVRFEGATQRDRATLLRRLAAWLDEDAPRVKSADPAIPARGLLLSVPGARPHAAAPPPLPPSEAWEEGAWDRAAERLADDYRAEGWLEAVYLGTTVALDSRAAVVDVTIRLREGPRITVDSIAFEGNEAFSVAELAEQARLAPGDPLAFERVEATRTAILRRYLARGHLYARVEAREDVDRDRGTAAVRFVVVEGPRVRIGRVLLIGNRRTRDDVLRGALGLSEGDIYDPERIAQSQAALLRLGVFRSAALRLQDPEVPQERKDLAVEVAERPWAALSVGAGFSIADGPRATVEYLRPNLLGRAVEGSIRTQVNYPLPALRDDLASRPPQDREFADLVEGRAAAGLRTPPLGVFSLPTSGRGDLVGEILHRKAYDLRRLAAIAGLDAGVTSRLSFSLQYELEVDDIKKSPAAGTLTQADLERLRFDEGVTTLHALRPSLALDHRDSATHPHRGWFGSAALEYAQSLGSPDQKVLGFLPGSEVQTHFLKLSAMLSGYLPFAGGSVVALALRGGRVFPLDQESQTIIPRRFFLGGASTMRGFAEEEMIPQDVRGDLTAEARHCATSRTAVGCTDRGRRIASGERPVSEGGEAFLLGKAELRFPLRGSIEAGLFVDLGNLWLDPAAYRLLDLRANVGAGLRLVTPIGPAALDVGWNPARDEQVNERTYAVHFSIGLF